MTFRGLKGFYTRGASAWFCEASQGAAPTPEHGTSAGRCCDPDERAPSCPAPARLRGRGSKDSSKFQAMPPQGLHTHKLGFRSVEGSRGMN